MGQRTVMLLEVTLSNPPSPPRRRFAAGILVGAIVAAVVGAGTFAVTRPDEGGGSLSYTVTVRRSCFCLLSAGPFRVTVVEGEVARVTQDRREIPLTDKVLDGIPLSIDQLFAYVDGARTAAGPDSVRVTYDPNLGYPTRIATSTIFFVSDSVITISVTDFQSHD